jgi:hypothetical protein
MAAEVTSWTVVVTTDTEAGGYRCGVLGEWSALTEETDVVGIACAVLCF